MAGMQTPQNHETPVIKADVALVPVNVMVRNKDGAFVDDLLRGDFVVYDNGIARQIDLFAHDEMPLDVALIVDASMSTLSYQTAIQQAAMDILDQLNLKSDRVALFCFGYSTYQLTSLSHDRHLLVQTLNKIQYLNLDGTYIKNALAKAAHYLRSKGIHIRSCSEACTAGFPDQRQFIPTILPLNPTLTIQSDLPRLRN
jgi:VWFA-related protein